jgi:hypothetical protein
VNPLEEAAPSHGPLCFCAECLGVVFPKDSDLRRCCPSYHGGLHYLGCPEADIAEDLEAEPPDGLCVACGEPALAKCYSEAGRRQISGMCEKCFDDCTKEYDE